MSNGFTLWDWISEHSEKFSAPSMKEASADFIYKLGELGCSFVALAGGPETCKVQYEIFGHEGKLFDPSQELSVATLENVNVTDPKLHYFVRNSIKTVTERDFLSLDPVNFPIVLQTPTLFGGSPWQTVLSVPYWNTEGNPKRLVVCSQDILSIPQKQKIHFLITLFRQCRLAYSEPKRELSSFSLKQIECLYLAARGQNLSEIAWRLNISPRTVRYHLERARENYGYATTQQAVVQAAKDFGFFSIGLTRRLAFDKNRFRRK
ncbi:helix-turn-helix transcriptional regulator [Aestuariispira insulae]|uniref:DNA-binding CsgD family transcriptional regulator n=1 Tax=Aestuariispira insulae TaxID=1461337 RepID=A0A3D9H1L6_9PROT|nr:helix-turn-helix transcriptional regulator [Aestuariispira insulae]RED43388.1 DNA-binding CsgD family transcriptional regulator [Aestuariispira insulae]